MARSNRSGGGSVDLPTLAITAAASAAAAYATSKIWAPGTLGAAATMPVLVAVLKEALARPTDVVTRAVPVRGVVRSSGGPHERVEEPFDADAATRGGRLDPVAPRDEPFDPIAAAYERVPQPGEIPGRSRARRRRAWRAAIVTGLLGFLVAAVALTVPELVAGESASGEGRRTTLFGGREKRAEPRDSKERRDAAPGSTVTVPPEQTVTVPPERTVTAPPAEPTPEPPPPEGDEPPEPEPEPPAPPPVPPPPPGG